MEKVEVVLGEPQEKKHVVRYDAAEDDTDAAVSSVYVRKDVVAELGNPESVKITIEAA